LAKKSFLLQSLNQQTDRSFAQKVGSMGFLYDYDAGCVSSGVSSKIDSTSDSTIKNPIERERDINYDSPI
jgi:rhamnogalacturonyl hydrolase YesR